MREYFHNEMAIWNNKSEDHLINMIYIRNGQQALLCLKFVYSQFKFQFLVLNEEYRLLLELFFLMQAHECTC